MQQTLQFTVEKLFVVNDRKLFYKITKVLCNFLRNRQKSRQTKAEAIAKKPMFLDFRQYNVLN